MSNPSEQDWRSEPWDLDVPYAYEHFNGKSLDEAEALFAENAMLYQEDLMFMPEKCFAYYVHAYINYLMSSNSKGDSDGASCFFSLYSVRKKEFASGGRELIARTIELMEEMKGKQQWYDADLGIYGSFEEKADVIKHELKALE